MPETEALEVSLRNELATVKAQAALTITDQPSYDRAVEILTGIKTWRKRWEEYWKIPRESAYATWKNITAKIKEADDPAAAVEATVKNRNRVWDEQQERLRQELQRKAEAEARAKEEAERAAQSVEMELAGASDEDIAAVVDAPSTAVAAPVEATYQKASGISRRSNWKAKVTDLKALAKAVGAGKVPVDYILPNQSKLDARAKADQSTLAIPGVVAYDDPIISGRSR